MGGGRGGEDPHAYPLHHLFTTPSSLFPSSSVWKDAAKAASEEYKVALTAWQCKQGPPAVVPVSPATTTRAAEGGEGGGEDEEDEDEIEMEEEEEEEEGGGEEREVEA